MVGLALLRVVFKCKAVVLCELLVTVIVLSYRVDRGPIGSQGKVAGRILCELRLIAKPSSFASFASVQSRKIFTGSAGCRS